MAEADAARGRTRMRVQVPAKLLGEDALVQRVREGDVRAFEQLYERYSAKLLSYCRHMLGSREEAEDVVQFTFVAAHKELTEHDREIRIAPWLYTVARNRCFSVLRKRREVSASELIEPSHDGLSAEVEQREDVMHVMHDIANLPPEQRSALLLTELESLSHEEVAEVLGCDRKKVKSLVFQARTSLAATREARETPCQDVREQISMLHGGSLRRNNIRRHLNDCKSCSAFSDQVRAQRAAIAVMLPVAPAVTLKASILGAVAQATTIGGVAATGAASAGGLLAAGGAAGGGAAAGGAAAG